MTRSPSRSPSDLARRFGERSRSRETPTRPGGSEGDTKPIGTFNRETYRMPRDQAREIAREWFARYPKAAYMTQVESWRVLDDGMIEFTMRRLPSAD
jgi:hypothetical protein